MDRRTFVLRVVLLLGWCLWSTPRLASAQVGVIPESKPADTEPPRVTLKLAGSECDVNEVEASLLRLKGVLGVDIEQRAGHLVVDYDSTKVAPAQMLNAIKNRMQGTDAVGQHMGGEKARPRSCQAHVAPAAAGGAGAAAGN